MAHLEQGVVLLPRAKGDAPPVILSQDAQKIPQRQLEAHDKAWDTGSNPDLEPELERSVCRQVVAGPRNHDSVTGDK